MSQKERKDIRLHSFLKKQIYSILAVFTKLKPNVFMKNQLHVSTPMYIRHTMYNLKSLVFLKIPYYLCKSTPASTFDIFKTWKFLSFVIFRNQNVFTQKLHIPMDFRLPFTYLNWNLRICKSSLNLIHSAPKVKK